ncbi:MAG: hypothetical protein R3342_12990 [Lutibacter sp.]|uniref:hypothetical protein n=1 Tax=Lutibacter sp. TaxID=1925666 RepID=UPI00299D08A1|nr:hypothetical protein [Lutibacter sp.]MDX1830448.1 hypothetical protein [Lutibacter sp.]
MESLTLKSLFLIPVLFIVDYMIMILAGSVSYIFGFNFSFSSIGSIVLLVSFVLLFLALVPDIKALIKKHKLS